MAMVPDTIELELDDIAQGGAGVGRWQGRVVFATGGLPGERVQVQVATRHKNYLRGQVTDVLRESDDRVLPRIAEADHMPWQHIAYPAQLRYKEQILRDQLLKLARVSDPPVAPIIAAPHVWAYRNNADLHVDGTRQQVGYFYSGTHTLYSLSNDPLLLTPLNEALHGLQRIMQHTSETHRLSVVLLRGSGTYGYAVGWLKGDMPLQPLATAWRDAVPSLAGVALNNDAADVCVHEDLDGVTLVLSPETFFQSNTEQAVQLLQVVQTMLALHPDETLLDAYSGVGTFALPLSRYVRQVLAIESHPAAVTDGIASARLNGIENVTFRRGAVEHVLTTINDPIDAVILDPPRRGCHPHVLRELLRIAPERIVYVSCHPGTLSRDLAELLPAYDLVQVQPLDMFPQTPHIESATLLQRRDITTT